MGGAGVLALHIAGGSRLVLRALPPGTRRVVTSGGGDLWVTCTTAGISFECAGCVTCSNLDPESADADTSVGRLFAAMMTGRRLP